jgi:hypothetical protein
MASEEVSAKTKTPVNGARYAAYVICKLIILKR